MHTWEMSKDAVPKGHVQITIYNEDTGERIATVFESEAYAHLIKAAPVMLKVLKSFVDYYSGSKRAHLGNGFAYKWVDQARDAIDQAEKE